MDRGTTDIEKLIGEWQEKTTIKEELKQKTIELFRKSVAAPEIRKALMRPPGIVELLMEREGIRDSNQTSDG